MNIFVLDENPAKAAEYHCNKHVVKMILESTQMLSAVHWLHLEKRMIGGISTAKSKIPKRVRDRKELIIKSVKKDEIPPYSMTHIRHPCTVWSCFTYGNYMWLLELAQALSNEYTKRYKKIHKSQAAIDWLTNHPPPGIPIKARTPFAVAIKNPDYRILDPNSMILLGEDDVGKNGKSAALNWEMVRDSGIKSGCITDENLNPINFEDIRSFSNLKDLAVNKQLYYTYYDVVESYRRYYIKDKVRFAKWEPHTEMPKWFKEGINAGK